MMSKWPVQYVECSVEHFCAGRRRAKSKKCSKFFFCHFSIFAPDDDVDDDDNQVAVRPSVRLLFAHPVDLT